VEQNDDDLCCKLFDQKLPTVKTNETLKIEIDNLLRMSDSSKQDSVGPYILQRVIGAGSTGKVKLAYHSETGQQVAIKIITKSAFDQKPGLQTKVRREIALMKVVSHPNILRLIDVFESPGHLYMVLEYAEKGELFDFLVARRFLPENVALDFFRQITLGLEYLHSHGICHRDLKPENILLDNNNRIKIADFGFARWIRRDIAETSCGSPHYAAPEVIRGMQYDGRRADTLSLGIILFALLAGYLPFDDPSIRNLLHKVKRGVFEMPAFPEDIAALIRQMLSVDPTHRPTLAEIKNSSCFRRNIDVDYIFPSPIPFRHYSQPIDPAALTEDMVLVLRQIGYTDDTELNTDLQAEMTTMAKVFVGVLSSQIDLERLPWDESAISSAHLLTPSNFMAGPAALGEFPASEDPFHRHLRPSTTSSLDISSVVSRPDWCVETATSVASVLQSASMELYGNSIWDVMRGAQEAIGDCGLQYFHPDPMTMYVRKSDGMFYVSIVADFTSSDEISVTVSLHKGAPDQFEDFRDRLFQVFRCE
jgi:BR serine/threonine kinase